jgi:hypothetical protein
MTGRRRSSRLPRRTGIQGLLPIGSVTLGSTDPWTSRADHLKTI